MLKPIVSLREPLTRHGRMAEDEVAACIEVGAQSPAAADVCHLGRRGREATAAVRRSQQNSAVSVKDPHSTVWGYHTRLCGAQV